MSLPRGVHCEDDDLHNAAVTHHSRRPCIAIGIVLAKKEMEMATNMPGWIHGSYGFHGNDGALFCNGKRGRRTLQPFGQATGQVVGCGIDWRARRVFYTLDGMFLGHDDTAVSTTTTTTASYHPDEWLPVVGLDSHACVRINTAGPFAFDLQGLMETLHQMDTNNSGKKNKKNAWKTADRVLAG